MEKTTYAEQVFTDVKDAQIEGALKIFSNEQRNIMSILYHSDTSQSTKQIRNIFINHIFYKITEDLHFKLVGAKPREIPIRIDYLPNKDLWKKLIDNEYNKAPKDIKPYQVFELQNKLLSRAGVKILGFSTIQTILENLEQLGFVIKQPSIKTKVNYYWTLNPKFFALLKTKGIKL